MATAKRDLTDPQVQGPRPSKDSLDKLVAIAIRVAQREGLLNEGLTTDPDASSAARSANDRRFA